MYPNYPEILSDVAIIIPSRIGSTRLPQKALLNIGELSLIEHVIHNLKNIAKNNLYIATDSIKISNLANKAGAIAIMTDENCLTGSDRVYQALQKIPENRKIKYVINVQGDMPFIKPSIITKIINGLKNNEGDIMTPVVKINNELAQNDSNVKVVINKSKQAMYFSRSLIPYGGSEFLYHVGIYGFKRHTLEEFVKLPQENCEKSEKLEQLRALEHGIKIGVCFSNEIPISVDTPDDLEKAREYYMSLHNS